MILSIVKVVRGVHPTHDMIVVAPHPDDEVLGCGGHIAKSKSNGYSVKIIVLTDGQSSVTSTNFDSGKVRRREAIAGCKRLGVAAKDIHFIGLDDRQLSCQTSTAYDTVSNIVKKYNIRNIYSPHSQDRHTDHKAAFKVCRRVAQGIDNIKHYQYFTWYYGYWPWVGYLCDEALSYKKAKQSTIYEFAGLKLLARANTISKISDHLISKKKALLEHKTQLNERKDEACLKGISEGSFIDNFITDIEVYSRYENQNRKCRTSGK